MTRATVLATALLASGCMHHARVGYLEAAQIDLPSDVRTVLVIDRSVPGSFGEHLMAGSEGALTGETWHLDAESAALALESLEGVLRDGQRFEVVDFRVDGREIDTSVWDREMTARQVRKLCRESRCDAVIALEAFDSDTLARLERNASATGVTYEAVQQTDLVATFRVYDGDTGAILDEQRARTSSHTSSGTEHTATQALSELPADGAALTGAASMGADYGARISPHQVIADRTFFGAGSKEMRQARKALNRGNLEQAEALWSAIADGSDPTLAAKATHNLAVAHELRGDVDGALRLARKAARMGDRNRTHTLVGQLRARQANDARVAQQLAPVAEAVADAR